MKKIETVPLLVALIPVALGAQEAEQRRSPAPEYGMVLVAGEWQRPTPETALRVLMDPQMESDRFGRIEPVTAVLRQVYEAYTAAEMRVVEQWLVNLILDGSEEEEWAGRLALTIAADTLHDSSGVPYAGGRDAFVKVYEALRMREDERARDYLLDLSRAGGLDYIRDLFEASEPPPPCFQPHGARPGEPMPPESEWCPPVRKTPWCDAGTLLLDRSDGAAYIQYVTLCTRTRL